MQGRGTHKENLAAPSTVGTTKIASIESTEVQTEDSKPQFQKTRTNNTLPGRTNMLNMESMTCVDIQIKDSNEAEVD